MARIARVVAIGEPHHITQRGNRRQLTFFTDDDYRAYITLMSQWCERYGVQIWAWCLMPNHVHLIAVPESEDGLRAAIGEAHRRYTRLVNFREGWRGCLWQGRFSSYVMDKAYTLAAAKYIEMNPVKARLAARPEDWPWSSAAAHLTGRDDAMGKAVPLLDMYGGDWREFLSSPVPKRVRESLQYCERTGRPLGNETFVAHIESMLGRVLKPQKAGRKPAKKEK
jgi:putative transposase